MKTLLVFVAVLSVYVLSADATKYRYEFKEVFPYPDEDPTCSQNRRGDDSCKIEDLEKLRAGRSSNKCSMSVYKRGCCRSCKAINTSLYFDYVRVAIPEVTTETPNIPEGADESDLTEKKMLKRLLLEYLLQNKRK